ncbi:hypothetical protein Z043_114966 [Scleropages formosus]|uniref:Uncharacterized protein n=1 Tax=Scleropages formosus TaxID=113540 RepID=A0A0P7WSC3_SCLFO|nr:hypothetical protein Z043_114966 [Scleropages formosus]
MHHCGSQCCTRIHASQCCAELGLQLEICQDPVAVGAVVTAQSFGRSGALGMSVELRRDTWSFVGNTRSGSSRLTAAEVMESTMGDSPGSNEDLTVKKKSKFKILKTRLFGRMKWRGTGGSIKQSQSASDITAPEGVKAGYDLEEEFIYSQGTLSSRALSHDSIFFSSQPQASDEPERVASQENVHGRVKALQVRGWDDVKHPSIIV